MIVSMYGKASENVDRVATADAGISEGDIASTLLTQISTRLGEVSQIAETATDAFDPDQAVDDAQLISDFTLTPETINDQLDVTDRFAAATDVNLYGSNAGEGLYELVGEVDPTTGQTSAFLLKHNAEIGTDGVGSVLLSGQEFNGTDWVTVETLPWLTSNFRVWTGSSWTPSGELVLETNTGQASIGASDFTYDTSKIDVSGLSIRNTFQSLQSSDSLASGIVESATFSEGASVYVLTTVAKDLSYLTVANDLSYLVPSDTQEKTTCGSSGQLISEVQFCNLVFGSVSGPSKTLSEAIYPVPTVGNWTGVDTVTDEDYALRLVGSLAGGDINIYENETTEAILASYSYSRDTSPFDRLNLQLPSFLKPMNVDMLGGTYFMTTIDGYVRIGTTLQAGDDIFHSGFAKRLIMDAVAWADVQKAATFSAETPN